MKGEIEDKRTEVAIRVAPPLVGGAHSDPIEE